MPNIFSEKNETPRVYTRGILRYPRARPYGRNNATQGVSITSAALRAWLHPRAYARGFRLSYDKTILNAAFTLIELLIVIGILAIIMVVIILVINPAELLRRTRDAARASDAEVISKALGIYTADVVSNVSLGNVSTTYVSVPDPAATSTAGDQCQGLSLPTLAPGWIYHCASPSAFRKVDGTGWIPVNLNQVSSRSPVGVLPVDPINQATSSNYYIYVTDGSAFGLASFLESSKYKKEPSFTNVIDPARYIAGSTKLIALQEGLVGLWTLDDATFADTSPSGNSGSCSACPVLGIAGKVGTAASFNGTSQYIDIGDPANSSLAFGTTGSFTYGLWAYTTSSPGAGNWTIPFFKGGSSVAYRGFDLELSGNTDNYVPHINDTVTGAQVFSGVTTYSQWAHVMAVVDRSTNTLNAYVNGNFAGSSTISAIGSLTNTWRATIGAMLDIDNVTPQYFWKGYLDDVRIYNRALSAADVSLLYNAEK